ncbi:MAG: tRNA (adenosine(37)-N6)-dimethylallyltransferase MiaA [Bacilli bacterium]|jgi:tRNA dimethylallyltransferase
MMIFVILGPTGVGKSSLALRLAKDFSGAIVNGDAYQIYRGMNIGTAKPTPEEMKLVPHYLFDILDVTQPFSVADYQIRLREIIDHRDSDQPLFIVGGNGLYVKAALYDYHFPAEKSYDTGEYDHYSNKELHAKLVKIDPKSAEKIHPNNRRRVLRALTIYLTTGESKTVHEAKQSQRLLYNAKFIGLRMDREVLYQRIEARVDQMVKEGLFAEVHHLYERYPEAEQALQAIGYKEIILGEKMGKSPEEIIDKIKQHTRNYAKRQMVFYRANLPVEWYTDQEKAYRAVKKYIEEQTK